MTRTRVIAASAVSLAGVLALAACGGSSGGGSTSSGAAGSITCVDGSIKAAGSSAQGNAITEWINAYQAACGGATIDYQPVGSGAGVEQFTAQQISFAGSDSAVSGDALTAANARCGAGPAINIPMVGSAIAIAYNLEGVDKLILNPKVVAGIFANTITKWNDPAIAALNPGVTLPDATIAQFHRSDSSGTSENLTKFLAATAPDAWTFEPGKDWVAPGGQGAKGSDQVIASVENTPNSVGYVDLSYLLDATKAKAAWIDNGQGAVEATTANAATTIAGASVAGTGNDLALKIDYANSAAGAYPMVLVTYEVACQSGLSADQNPALVKAFLTYAASDDAQALLTQNGYVPITGDLLTKVRTAVGALAS
ncbi:MAG: phosphate ABC transporter substrate-binding protein PstS [Candidatus Nanopelagicales bacterium]